MKVKDFLFWIEWVKKIIWDPFWWVILFLVILWVPFLRVWWWLFLPLMLSSQLRILYLWWIDWDYNYTKEKWLLLEVTPPREVLAPFKAMEDVFSAVWSLMDIANFRERWCDGELANSPYWYSWEIASIEGKIHFYIRCLQEHRLSIEMSLYAHYPDIEINQVSDYTKLVPATVPNEEWDMYGEDWDYREKKGGQKIDAYPIKTYEKFFEPQGERITAEEKRIDPIISLLEGMSKLGLGEHYWVQFITVPITEHDEPGFWEESQKTMDKLARREEEPKKNFLLEAVEFLLTGLPPGFEKQAEMEEETKPGGWDKGTTVTSKTTVKLSKKGEKKEIIPSEMKLTPGEREILTEVENKMKKPLFRTTIRGVYVARRENWNAPHRALMRSYTSHFITQNLNTLRFLNETRPRVHYFWRKRRVFLRARKMFRMTVLRFPPLFPNRLAKDLNPIMSTEELATMFHFPLRVTGMVAPTMVKVESKKAGPPPNLPVE